MVQLAPIMLRNKSKPWLMLMDTVLLAWALTLASLQTPIKKTQPTKTKRSKNLNSNNKRKRKLEPRILL